MTEPQCPLGIGKGWDEQVLWKLLDHVGDFTVVLRNEQQLWDKLPGGLLRLLWEHPNWSGTTKMS